MLNWHSEIIKNYREKVRFNLSKNCLRWATLSNNKIAPSGMIFFCIESNVFEEPQ